MQEGSKNSRVVEMQAIVEKYNTERPYTGITPSQDAYYAIKKLKGAKKLSCEIQTRLMVIYNTRPRDWTAYCYTLGKDLVSYVGW